MELSGTINRSRTLSGSMIARGLDGRGIVSIAKTGTSGLVDTYTITYTDATTSTFTVTNGANGQITATSFAEEFSSSKAYAAGDYVVYSGQLYQFTTAHAAGAWNASHATAVQIADQVGELKSALYDEIVKENTYSSADVIWVDGSYVAYDSGNIRTLSGYSYCKVPLSETAVHITGYTNAAPGSIIGLAFFTAAGAYLSGDRSTNAGRYDYNFDLDVPATSGYVLISCRTDYKSTFSCTESYGTPSFDAQIVELRTDIEEGTTVSETLGQNDVTWVDGYYAGYDTGKFIAQPDYSYCVVQIPSAATRLTGITNAAPGAVIGMHFKDELGNYITGYRNEWTGHYEFVFDLPIPAGAKTAYFSCRTEYKSTFSCTEKLEYDSLFNLSEKVKNYDSFLPGIIGSGDDVYYGETIKIDWDKTPKKYTNTLWKDFKGSEIQNLADYRLHVCQSLAIYNDYVFCMCADGTFTILDYNTKSIVSSGTYTPAEHQHANSAQFTSIFYSASDEFPLLLLSRCGNNAGDSGYDECLVYRITRANTTFTFTLINSIAVDFRTYGISWCVDNNTNLLYAAYSLNGNWQVVENNPVYFSVFNMPTASEILSGQTITLSKSDAIAEMVYDHITFQSMTVYGGIIYTGVSTGGEGIFAVSVWENRVLSKVYFKDIYEVEGVTIYNGKIYVDQTKGTDTAGVNPMRIYELTF